MWYPSNEVPLGCISNMGNWHLLLSLQPPPLGIGFSAGSPTETMASSCFTTPDFGEVFIPDAALDFTDPRWVRINYELMSDANMDSQLPTGVCFPDLKYAPSGPGWRHPSADRPQAPPTSIPPLIQDTNIDEADVVALLGAMPDSTPFPTAFKTLLGATMALWNACRTDSSLTHDFIVEHGLDTAIASTFDFFTPSAISPT